MPNDQRYKGITVRKETLDRLDTIKHQGQSYDGLINEILDELTALARKLQEQEHK